MPKIVITEVDNTSPGVLSESTDVVYIPGFVNLDRQTNSGLYNSAGEYVGIKVHEPTLFTSISTFENLCGTEPAYFNEDQKYTDLAGITADGDLTGFSADAIPYHNIMFTEGQADPAYVMAKEILSAGLPVLFERMNEDDYTQTFNKVSEAPADWDTDYKNYQKGIASYSSISTPVLPEMFTKQNGKAYLNASGGSIVYYTRTAVKDVSEGDAPTIAFSPVSEVETYTKDGIQVVMDEGSETTDGVSVPAYYVKNSDLVSESDLTHYYFKSPIYFSNVTPVYKAGTYYLKQNDNYVLLDSTVAPADWGSADKYYTKSGSSYTVVTFTKEITPAFNDESLKGKTIITPSASDSTVFEVVTEEPETWGNTSVKFYTLSTEVLPIKAVTSGPSINAKPIKAGSVISEGTEFIPHSWVVGYMEGVCSSLVFKQVEGINPGTSAEAAPAWDPSAIYRIVSSGINISTMYDSLSSVYAINDSGLADKGNYSIKYLTSGGYPTYEYSQNSLVAKMLNLCKERGDCVAFIDHTDNPYRNQNIDQPGSLYYAIKNDLTFQTSGEFATMFTPWATYNRTTTDLDEQMRKSKNYDATVRMPGSFAYFQSLGDSLTVNPNWLAVAGVARGLVQNLASGGMTTNIPNGTADKMSPRDAISINPITNIKPYGYTIWGNRTLKNNATEGNLTATSFLNVRNLVSDIKKEVYRTARRLTFEQNSDILWINFKAELTPLLDKMLHGYGISSYKLQLDTKHPKYNEKATLCVKIIISPIEPVEDFYVSIIMQDDQDAVISE